MNDSFLNHNNAIIIITVLLSWKVSIHAPSRLVATLVDREAVVFMLGGVFVVFFSTSEKVIVAGSHLGGEVDVGNCINNTTKIFVESGHFQYPQHNMLPKLLQNNIIQYKIDAILQ